jgi:hypothetical protein
VPQRPLDGERARVGPGRAGGCTGGDSDTVDVRALRQRVSSGVVGATRAGRCREAAELLHRVGPLAGGNFDYDSDVQPALRQALWQPESWAPRRPQAHMVLPHSPAQAHILLPHSTALPPPPQR